MVSTIQEPTYCSITSMSCRMIPLRPRRKQHQDQDQEQEQNKSRRVINHEKADLICSCYADCAGRAVGFSSARQLPRRGCRTSSEGRRLDGSDRPAALTRRSAGSDQGSATGPPGARGSGRLPPSATPFPPPGRCRLPRRARPRQRRRP